ncbi:alpha/beta hydrolase [Dethiothermospora halolimnae]|uniref:alpha/beta hydrolase n=1 Tax=Dethiothermospora halolimnae TaxID=3114390 RepID=UPI003CCBC923
MTISFKYEKRDIKYSSGYIFKGKHYRCSYIKYNTLYNNPAPGTEHVELYNFHPKGDIKASTLILHGLGSRNIKFLLWMGPHLASAGVNATVLIFPGNHTRVEHGSVSGKSFLYPDIDVMYRFWEHSVVDVMSSIDLLENLGLWKDNNCLLGYCLGGMVSSMVSAIDKRINQTIFMTAGGHIPKILFESPATKFVRRMYKKGFKADNYLDNKKKLYEKYKKDLKIVNKLSLSKLLSNDTIHPLLKIDPLSYCHLLDESRVTIVDALFDRTLPLDSRKSLYKRIKGSKRYIIPMGHVSWLPFEYLLAKYILHKVNIYDKQAKKMLLTKEKIEDPLSDDFK